MIGVAMIVLVGSAVGTVAITGRSGCLVYTELRGWVAGSVALPDGLRWAGPAAIALSIVLAVRLARRPVRSRGVALLPAWLAMAVLANPLWCVTGGYRSIDLGPGGVVAMLAMLTGLIVLTVALLRRRSVSVVPDGRPEPLNGAELADWLRRDGRAIAMTAGAAEVERVAVAVTDDGALAFDTDRDGRLAASLVGGAAVSLLVGAEPPVRVHGVARLVCGVERDRCLELYLRRFPERLARALSDRTAHVVLTPGRVDPF